MLYSDLRKNICCIGVVAVFIFYPYGRYLVVFRSTLEVVGFALGMLKNYK